MVSFVPHCPSCLLDCMLQGALQLHLISLRPLILTLSALAAFATLLRPLRLLPLRLLLDLAPAFALTSTAPAFRTRVRRIVSASVSSTASFQTHVALMR